MLFWWRHTKVAPVKRANALRKAAEGEKLPHVVFHLVLPYHLQPLDAVNHGPADLSVQYVHC